MIISISQPAYLPWAGYFDRILKSDLHIVLDHVQYESNSKSVTNRNKVRTPQGWTWLTVPVQTKGLHGQMTIDQLKIAEDKKWPKKHWETIRHNYRRAPFYEEYANYLEEVYKKEWTRLAPLMRETNDFFRNSLDIVTEIKYSTEMNTEGKKSDLILNLCKAVHATKYISGPFGRDYLELDRFKDAGIEVLFHDYQLQEYKQLHPGFEPYMSIVDILMAKGPEARDVVESLGETLVNQ